VEITLSMSKEFVITLVPALIMLGFAIFAIIKISS